MLPGNKSCFVGLSAGYSSHVVTTKPFSMFSLQGTRPHLSHCIPFLRPWSSREKRIHYEPKGTFFVNQTHLRHARVVQGVPFDMLGGAAVLLTCTYLTTLASPCQEHFSKTFFKVFPSLLTIPPAVPGTGSGVWEGTSQAVRSAIPVCMTSWASSGAVAAPYGGAGRLAWACNMWLSRYPSGGCPPLEVSLG